MQDLILDILNAAEKQGILTGGSDSEGNFAFVVVDSKSLITITMRPGGRGSVIVGGEGSDFDLSEDADDSEDAAIEFFNTIAQALADDNLDSKADKIIKIIETFTEEDEDEESDEDSESDEEDTSDDEGADEEDAPDDSEEEDDEEPVDDDDSATDDEEEEEEEESDDSDEEDDTEEASTNEDDLTSDELALMIDHMPAIIDDMIETAAAKGTPAAFEVDKFFNALGASSGGANAVTFAAGMTITLRFGKTISVELDVGEGKPNAGFKKYTQTGPRVLDLINLYNNNLKLYGKLNNQAKTIVKYTDLFEDLMQSIAKEEPQDVLKSKCRTIATLLGKPRALMGMNDKFFHCSLGGLSYSVGFTYLNNVKENEVYVVAQGAGQLIYLARFKADYMVTIGAALAKTANLIAGGRFEAPIRGGKTKCFSQTLMNIATKMGYSGESDTSIKMKTSGVMRETAGIELATTQKQVKDHCKKLGLICTVQDGEYRVTFTKEQMPSAKKREDHANYTDDADDAMGSASMMREWYDKHGKEQANLIETATDTRIGRTIYHQLGANKFMAMTGAKNLVFLEKGLQCDLPSRSTKNKASRMQIVLGGNDLYTLAFYKWNAKTLEMKMVGHHINGLDSEALLASITDQTGLALRL